MLGGRPEECVVVEDAPTGVGAGMAAGCRVMGVLGTHRAEELRAAGATGLWSLLMRGRSAADRTGASRFRDDLNLRGGLG